jgi:hypothetical protein
MGSHLALVRKVLCSEAWPELVQELSSEALSELQERAQQSVVWAELLSAMESVTICRMNRTSGLTEMAIIEL